MKIRMMLTILYCGLVVGIGFAQNTNSGDLRGTVTDTTGAVIPGVSVEVKDVDKSVVKTYVTDGAGLYDTGSITPDHYLLTFTKSGFGTFVRGPITLDVSIQTIDAQHAATRLLLETAARQADALAYADAFLFMAAIGLVTFTLIPLMAPTPVKMK